MTGQTGRNDMHPSPRPDPMAIAPNWLARPGLVRGLAWATATIGGLVLIGWWLGLQPLKQVFPGLVTMKPNAALGILLAGGALVAIPGPRRRCRLSFALGIAAAIIGLVTMFEYGSGLDLGIDQILGHEPPGSIGSLSRGRMHPATALNLALQGMAIALIALDRGFKTAHALAFLSAAIAGSALVGYSYGVRLFVGLAAYNQMAVHSALAMLMLAVGILLTRPTHGLTGPIVGDTAGGLMARRLLPVAILVPVILDGLVIHARKAGAFDEAFGSSVRVNVTIAIFFGFIAWNARAIHRVDLRRERVEADLRRARSELEDRVRERTAELERANAALVSEVAVRKEVEEAALAASRAKGEFLANMSHEIRTPLNGILGMTELALGTGLSARQREYLDLVKSSADALLTVIGDILDFSKIEAGKLGLDPIPFPLRDAVTDSLRSLALRAHGKGLELACRIAPEVPSTVVGDSGRLRQVLVNLVGNAIKFTETGEVVVSVDKAPRDDGATILRFDVADTGIGIAPEKRAAIFAPFEQADGSTTRKYGGTGLGLTISARLVELMGGSIGVDDNPGGGSIFRFTARFAPSVEAGGVEANSLILDGLRVLIVDDNRTNRTILEEVLSQWGCRPVAVPGGPEALLALEAASARDHPFALVLLDGIMPGMDGRELAGRIQGDPGFGAPRMMMLTSGGPDESNRAAGLGIGGWLTKPVRQSELLGSMLDLLAPAGLAAEAPGPPPAVAAPMRAAGRSLRVLLAEDHPINQKVATRMLENLGHRVTVVGDGRAAVEASGSGPFDLILMDVQMPEMDGFEATAAIRARERTSADRLPIVALTAHAMAGDRERCLAADFDDYLSKPIQAAAILGAFERLGLLAEEIAPPAPTPRDDAAPAFDRRAALEGLGGDEDLLDEVLGLFLDDCPRLLAEVHAAILADDPATLGRLAHTMAGVAGNFAAADVAVAARRIEAMARAGTAADAFEFLPDLDRAVDRFRAAVLATA